MEHHYYIFKAENRSKAHGSNCDKLSFVDRFSFEKLHQRKLYSLTSAKDRFL
jgi:hypothetical protein